MLLLRLWVESLPLPSFWWWPSDLDLSLRAGASRSLSLLCHMAFSLWVVSSQGVLHVSVSSFFIEDTSPIGLAYPPKPMWHHFSLISSARLFPNQATFTGTEVRTSTHLLGNVIQPEMPGVGRHDLLTSDFPHGTTDSGTQVSGELWLGRKDTCFGSQCDPGHSPFWPCFSSW